MNRGCIHYPPTHGYYDAIQSAGGFTEAADQEAINLAAILEDEDRY